MEKKALVRRLREPAERDRETVKAGTSLPSSRPEGKVSRWSRSEAAGSVHLGKIRSGCAVAVGLCGVDLEADMTSLMSDAEKVNAYLNAVEEYVINPIQKSPVGEHCVASLLLIFAGIDGLARLTDSDPKAKVGKRFQRFIGTLGADYDDKKTELYELRNALAHNALNAGTFISQAPLGAEHNLREVGGPGGLYVNTRVFCDDFVAAFRRLKERFASEPAFLASAAQRLEVYNNAYVNNVMFPTTKPPPSYFPKFVKTKEEAGEPEK